MNITCSNTTSYETSAKPHSPLPPTCSGHVQGHLNRTLYARGRKSHTSVYDEVNAEAGRGQCRG